MCSVTVPLTLALAPLELILKLTEQHRISTPLGNINTLHSHRPLKPPDLPLQKHNGRRRLWHTLRAVWRDGLERGRGRQCLRPCLLGKCSSYSRCNCSLEGTALRLHRCLLGATTTPASATTVAIASPPPALLVVGPPPNHSTVLLVAACDTVTAALTLHDTSTEPWVSDCPVMSGHVR